MGSEEVDLAVVHQALAMKMVKWLMEIDMTPVI